MKVLITFLTCLTLVNCSTTPTKTKASGKPSSIEISKRIAIALHNCNFDKATELLNTIKKDEVEFNNPVDGDTTFTMKTDKAYEFLNIIVEKFNSCKEESDLSWKKVCYDLLSEKPYSKYDNKFQKNFVIVKASFFGFTERKYSYPFGSVNANVNSTLENTDEQNVIIACAKQEKDKVSKLLKQAEKEREAKKNSLKCRQIKNLAAICGTVDGIKRHEDIIKQEKKVGKISGFVNMNTLHQAGSALLRFREYLKKEKKEYKKLNKREFRVHFCKALNEKEWEECR